jgi:ATP synthase F1 complex assembly factor 2
MDDRILHRRQEQAWTDLHEFVEERFDHSPARAIGFSEGMLMARKRDDKKSSVGLPHPPTLLDSAADWTATLDAWHLVALSSVCSQAKSFLVAWAMLQPNSPLEAIVKATEAARVEEEFQISSWGLVEGGHDYDRLNCSIQLASAKMFARTIAMDNELYK